MEVPKHHEQTLKKLLIKICMRIEMERFRIDPTCWTDKSVNPLLHRTLCALQQCPILLEANLPFQRILSTLPILSAELKVISGKDLLLGFANDLGNLWTLALATSTQGDEPEADLFDDVEREETQEDANYVAMARKLRLQSMRSFQLALVEITRMPGGFEEAYGVSTRASNINELPPSFQTAVEHAFDALDFVITDGILVDELKRKDLKHKAKQLSNPLLGPLLNAANPLKVLPMFVRLAFRTGLAEKMAMRGTRQKLAELQRGLPPEVAT